MKLGCGEGEAGMWGAWSWDVGSVKLNVGSVKLGCGERESGMWGA